MLCKISYFLIPGSDEALTQIHKSEPVTPLNKVGEYTLLISVTQTERRPVTKDRTVGTDPHTDITIKEYAEWKINFLYARYLKFVFP
jgi:hypothetical protein